MNCATPFDIGVLTDYWSAALMPSEEEKVEEHLLSCDFCGDRLREVIALAEAVRSLAREGSLLMVVSDAFVKRLAQEGLHVREYAPPRGGSIACTVTAEDDFLIGRLAADLSGAKRVDLSLCNAVGAEQMRLADIPFRAGAGSVAFQQSITYAKAAPSETLVARLLTIDDAGGERLLGAYTFQHTRTLPGPGAR
ncbi:MAG: hypothetical protein LAO79_06575 [Acidobacteriia bacterium]|nr:hypothetical protein [Terriglobia bacterium]